MADFNADLTGSDESPMSTEFSTSVSPGSSLVSNVIVSEFGRGGSFVQVSVFDFDDDQAAKITVGTDSSTSDDLGVMLRADGASGGNGYALYWDSGTDLLFVLEYTSGSLDILKKSTSVTLATGDTFSAQISGSDIEVFKNGSSIDTLSDTVHTTGQPGVFTNSGQTNDITAYEASDLGGAAATLHTLLLLGAG